MFKKLTNVFNFYCSIKLSSFSFVTYFLKMTWKHVKQTSQMSLRELLLNWLFNVTINDISVIYVTAHRCAGGLKKLDLRSGSQRHRHFVGFFNVPVLAPTRDQPFYTVIPRVPRQSGWTYSGKVAKMKTGNLYRDVVIRRLINRDLKNN